MSTRQTDRNCRDLLGAWEAVRPGLEAQNRPGSRRPLAMGRMCGQGRVAEDKLSGLM